MTKEEMLAVREQIDALTRNHREISDEELEQVNGGQALDGEIHTPDQAFEAFLNDIARFLECFNGKPQISDCRPIALYIESALKTYGSYLEEDPELLKTGKDMAEYFRLGGPFSVLL